MAKKVSARERLFNPNLTFNGNVEDILKDFPPRSEHLECRGNGKGNAKDLNSKFIKDGYMYLFRGAKKGQETGFYSRDYAEGRTIESMNLDPWMVGYAQMINGNTPFISATTDLYTAASFSQKDRIYVLRVPVADVYTFGDNDDELLEKEYMIPDFIGKEEVLRSFRWDKFKTIYWFLTDDVGLDIFPSDIGTDDVDLNYPDVAKIDRLMKFNNGGESLDPILGMLQKGYMQESQGYNVKVFTKK